MKRIEVAKEAVKEAEKILMKGFNNIKKIESRGKKDLVTDVDFKSEKRIIQIIQKNFPDDNIWGEETGKIEKGSDYTWLIDPLDGTNNFCFSIPFFGTQIALMAKEKAVLSVVNIPHLKELYVAKRGRGAFLNGKRIRVSKRGLGEGLMIHGTGFSIKKDAFLETFSKMFDHVFSVRVYGVAAFSFPFVAVGRVDLLIDCLRKPMDVAPGCLLIEEAGGKVTDFDGNKWDPFMKTLVASNGKIHEEVLRIIKS